jgi:hypothetical protein
VGEQRVTKADFNKELLTFWDNHDIQYLIKPEDFGGETWNWDGY